MTTKTPVDIGTLITSIPDVQGGMPCLAGTRIPVLQIAVMHQEGMSIEEMVEDFPHVPESHFYAGVAYYLANRERMDAEITEEIELYDRMAQEARREREGKQPSEGQSSGS